MPHAARVEAALAESLERHRAILDTAVDGIITISDRGIIESFNHAAERMFGYAAEEVIGLNINFLMPEPYRSGHDAYVKNYLDSGRPKIIGIGREVEGLRKNGTVFPMDLAVGEVHLPGRRLFTGITRDISSRRAVENEARRRLNELAHASRLTALGEMATGLAHEVNQPLTAIISHASACLRMLAGGRGDAETMRDSLQQIARQGERAGEVIKRLRSFVQKGEMRFAFGELNVVVRDVMWLMGHEIKTGAVEIHLRLDPELPQAEMDRVQIEQVVFNLARNALDALKNRGKPIGSIALTTSIGEWRARPAVRFCIEDDGPGFGELEPAKLFESYFTTKADGVGQGLSICRSIIEAHDGHVWAEQGGGGGARFQFLLPVLQAV